MHCEIIKKERALVEREEGKSKWHQETISRGFPLFSVFLLAFLVVLLFGRLMMMIQHTHTHTPDRLLQSSSSLPSSRPVSRCQVVECRRLLLRQSMIQQSENNNIEWCVSIVASSWEKKRAASRDGNQRHSHQPCSARVSRIEYLYN